MKRSATLCAAVLILPLMACQREVGTRGDPASGAAPERHAPDCAGAVARVQAAIEQQTPYLTGPRTEPKIKRWFARTMSVMREACEQDRWPAGLVACMAGLTDLAGLNASCNQQMPAELQRRFQDRMTKALNDMMPELTAQ